MNDARHPVIVVVDDEAVVTQTIQTFLQLETDYEVIAFHSPMEALHAMDRRHVDLVISDFLMPQMNGLEFLSEVRKRHPDVVRVLLTGYADKENAIRSINEVELFQYLEKPWDNDQLLLVIRNGLRDRRLELQLAEKIRELDRTAHNYERLARQHDRLKEELALARRVQRTLLPNEFPGPPLRFAANYRPALEVGGDFYDVASLDGGAVAAFVADATGHGVQAALSTTLLKSAFARVARNTAGGSPGAAAMLREMNAALHHILPSETFVAATLAVVDAGRGTMTVTGAGGPHPFHVAARGGGVQRIACNGLFLGAVDPDTYPAGDEVTVSLEPGDRVVFYTDGLSEVMGNDGDEFGECCLVDALERLRGRDLDSLGDALLELAAGHAVADHEWDDVTVLAVERAAQ